MSHITSTESPTASPADGYVTKSSIKTVAMASLVGTTIEWYDFFIFSSMSAIVFNKLFFPTGDPVISTILAYASFAVGFLVRPFGGAIMGHFGDKFGRRPLLVFTLLVMGMATVLIGLLPTYAQIGIAAPIALLVLRMLQGLALGGEWGGAVLMAYEHAEPKNRVRYASFPQAGLALGLCLSTATIAILSAVMSNEAFLDWGWRIPFVGSVLILGLGLFIRSQVFETPEFAKVKDQNAVVKVPAIEVVSEHKKTVFLGWVSRLIEGIVFAIYAVFAIPLLVSAGYSRAIVLTWIAIAAFCLLFTIPFVSGIADRYGARRVFFWSSIANGIAAFPILWMLQYSGSPVLAFVALVFAFGFLWAPCYGPQAAMYCELFEARLRYTGISLVYQIGAVFSISLTPIVATWLTSINDGQLWYLACYMLVAGLLSALSVRLMGKRHV